MHGACGPQRSFPIAVSKKSRRKLTGRIEDDGARRHVRLYHWLMDTPAWQDLDPVARCAYIELARRYAGPESTNGRISVSVRQLGVRLHVSLATASRALRKLEDHGFIVTVKKGAFSRKVRHATEYRLTEFKCDITGDLPTKDFARWRKNTVPVVKLIVSSEQPIGISHETVCKANGSKMPPTLSPRIP